MRKYIKQINSKNFVYPNNTVSEYDVEIIHDINNNSISGTVENFVVSGATSTGMTISFDWTWSKNGAEPFVSDSGYINLLSVHMMVPEDKYFGAWRMIDYVNNVVTGNTGYSGTMVINIVPSDYSQTLTIFNDGVYNFEIRFIGHRSIYPVCSQYTVTEIPVTPTPTPTPTPTSTPINPTPTPSPTPVSLLYTTGATLNVTDTGYIKYTTPTGQTYFNCTTLGTQVLSDCLNCLTITPGFPLADVASFTITNCGSYCAGPSPTPTPSAGPIDYVYYIMTDCQTFETKYSQQLPNGTYNSGDRVEGSYGYFYVISGSIVSAPGLETYITPTGDFGCPY